MDSTANIVAHSKGWKDFRAELESRFPERKFSFVDAGPEVGDRAVACHCQ